MFFEVTNPDLEALKQKDEAPSWMTPAGYTTLTGTQSGGGYLLPEETPKGMYSRLAKAAANKLNRPDLEPNFFEMLWRGWLGPSSPVMSNFGAGRGLPISCFGAAATDTMPGILEHVHEQAHLTWRGGGVSTHLNDIRAIGAPIKSGGKSDGILTPLRMLNATVSSLSQNSMRRGSIAAYLHVDHPDIHTFLRMRKSEVAEEQRFLKIHHGVTITDAFIDRLMANDSEAAKLWEELLTLRMETGEPYLIFESAANRDNPAIYQKLGLKVNGSNLCCIRGSERVITKAGISEVNELVGQRTSVWDGQDWAETEFVIAGRATELVEINLLDGRVLRVTPTHRLLLNDDTFIEAWQTIDSEENYFLKTHNLNSWFDSDRGVAIVNAELVTLDAEEFVYSCQVPTTGAYALANGLMTGNSEIFLATSDAYSFVCCLSSLNLAKYDEWKNTNAIKLAIYFLDAVMQEFIDKAKDIPEIGRAYAFALASRALGLGVMGWHTYLQSHLIPFESKEAAELNVTIFEQIRSEADKASAELASTYGEPEWCKDTGKRNTHVCVTGDTFILTKEGQLPIESLVGKNTEVWNGEQWSSVVPFETGVSPTLEVTLSNGMMLKCTPEHKFLVATSKRDAKFLGGLKIVEMCAKDLRVGDCMPKFFTEASGSELNLDYAYESGLFCGKGGVNRSQDGGAVCNELRLFGSKMKLESVVSWKSQTLSRRADEICGYLPDEILPKGVVPLEYSVLSKQQWLCGLIDASGSYIGKGISVSSTSREFAFKVALLIQSLGGEPFVNTIYSKRPELGNDKTAIRYRVSISKFSLNLVFSLCQPNTFELNIKPNQNKIGRRHLVAVESIAPAATEKTYCFTEPLKGQGVFNGILTKQCAIAPTLTNSSICGGVSRSIEPLESNAGLVDVDKGIFKYYNPILAKVLEGYDRNNDLVWRSIAANSGSVQHLNFLSDLERDVFKTAREIDQHVLVDLAAERGVYIDQGQSLNLFFNPDADPNYVHSVHWKACKLKLKSLYYLKTGNQVKAASVVNYALSSDEKPSPEECSVCQ